MNFLFFGYYCSFFVFFKFCFVCFVLLSLGNIPEAEALPYFADHQYEKNEKRNFLNVFFLWLLLFVF